MRELDGIALKCFLEHFLYITMRYSTFCGFPTFLAVSIGVYDLKGLTIRFELLKLVDIHYHSVFFL